ncbi:sigma-70 family RNA polymerase sigma factor [uncultured Gimesia sp.]|uniref:sigma-70 family RNA polymerase sigma factor n=1 Tax=uncultured Gimesia sp. TaxID=1678688 RepID=UPI0026313B5D|nr:sigma-70 family RNA polymerase sigma factor [uncultured Gimesia sp.]
MSAFTSTITDQDARRAFSTLLNEERLRIFGYIRTLVPHNSDAEDVYQHVCLTLWNKFSEFDQERDFFSWACGIAFFTVCNFRRSVQRDRHFFSQELIESMSVERIQHLNNHNIRLEHLRDCFDKLKTLDQELLISATYEKQSIKDFAVKAGKTVQTLYNRLSTLRRELAECVMRKLKSEEPS